MSESMRVVTEGENKGAWLNVPNGMICLVDQRDKQYVALYDGQPYPDGNGKTKLPYALSFGVDGDVMLQLPGEQPGEDPVIVQADHLRKLVLSVRKI